MTVIYDGFEDYTLARDYGNHKSGTTIRVDPERKAWLDEHGFGTSSPGIPGMNVSSVPVSRPKPPKRPIPDLPIPPTVEELP